MKATQLKPATSCGFDDPLVKGLCPSNVDIKPVSELSKPESNAGTPKDSGTPNLRGPRAGNSLRVGEMVLVLYGYHKGIKTSILEIRDKEACPSCVSKPIQYGVRINWHTLWYSRDELRRIKDVPEEE